MSELNVEGMALAPGVVETIVSIAVSEVEGVACVGSAGPRHPCRVRPEAVDPRYRNHR